MQKHQNCNRNTKGWNSHCHKMLPCCFAKFGILQSNSDWDVLLHSLQCTYSIVYNAIEMEISCSVNSFTILIAVELKNFDGIWIQIVFFCQIYRLIEFTTQARKILCLEKQKRKWYVWISWFSTQGRPLSLSVVETINKLISWDFDPFGILKWYLVNCKANPVYTKMDFPPK